MLVPTRDDRFSFGLWTVGWQARDTFGDANARPAGPGRGSIPPLRAGRLRCDASRRRPDPFASDEAERARRIKRFQDALEATGMVVPMVTTNLFSHPIFKDGAFTSNDRGVRRYAVRKVMRNLNLAAELGAETYVFWGGREGSETDAAKDVRAALDRFREAMDLSRAIRHRPRLSHPVRDRAETERATGRHLAAYGRKRSCIHLDPRTSRDGRVEPRSGP